MSIMTYADAIGTSIAEEMRKDDSVFVMGENVGLTGNVYKVLKGLYEEFGPERIKDTPISEEIIVNAAIGAALMGLKPVAEIMYIDFLTLGSDSLINQAAKAYFLSAGKLNCPMVIRTNFGPDPSHGPQHTGSIEVFLANIPGLKVVTPATPTDCKGLMKTAIHDNNPVLFLEHKMLYYTKEEVPEIVEPIPFGQAKIRREGKDVTIVAYSKAVHTSLEAAEILAEKGIEAEVIDLRTLMPLDMNTVNTSVQKTGRAAVVYEAPVFYGPGAEIVTGIQEKCFGSLKGYVMRFGGRFAPIPYAPELFKDMVPQALDIAAEIEKQLGVS